MNEPLGPFSVIYADPPWWYASRSGSDKLRGGARRHYPLMCDEDLLALAPFVAGLAGPDCLLALWYTGPRARFAIQLCEAWGFRFATAFGFTWLKRSRSSMQPLCSVGSYTGACAEAVLFGVRGSMLPSRKLVPSGYYGPRGSHSEKPQEIRRRLESMYPSARRIELFARGRHEGWAAWGLEADAGRTARLREEPEGQQRLVGLTDGL